MKVDLSVSCLELLVCGGGSEIQLKETTNSIPNKIAPQRAIVKRKIRLWLLLVIVFSFLSRRHSCKENHLLGDVGECLG